MRTIMATDRRQSIILFFLLISIGFLFQLAIKRRFRSATSAPLKMAPGQRNSLVNWPIRSNALRPLSIFLNNHEPLRRMGSTGE